MCASLKILSILHEKNINMKWIFLLIWVMNKIKTQYMFTYTLTPPPTVQIKVLTKSQYLYPRKADSHPQYFHSQIRAHKQPKIP